MKNLIYPTKYQRSWTLLLMLALFGLKVVTNISFAQTNQVPFTLDDRDRTIRLEEKINSTNERISSLEKSTNERITSLEKSMDVKFDSQQQQLNDIKNLFYWGFGIMLSFMLFLFGFIIWDRRTTTEPIREHTQTLIQTLREYAKEQPKLADILRSHGLM